MLRCVGTVRHPGFTVDVDIAIDNEIVAVTGDNGTGKTTLLHMIAGLHRLSTGRLVLGDDILDDPGQKLFVEPHHRDAAMLFQDSLLLPHLNVVDNVAFGLRRRGVNRAEARESAMQQLTVLGVDRLALRNVSTLSGGQSQRVALARALVCTPRVILLDEPFDSLDRNGRREFRALFAELLAAAGVPSLIVTHDDSDIDVMCSRQITLTRVAQRNDDTTVNLERTTGFEPATLTLAR